MICLSVFAEEYPAARAAVERFGSAIDYVELRLDTADDATLQAAAAAIPRPLILTVRHPEHGGLFSGNESARLARLRDAINCRPAYLDVELGTAAESLIAEYPQQPMILSAHPAGIDPSRWPAMIGGALSKNPAVVKFVPTAIRWEDNLAILAALENARSPVKHGLACFCSGEKGIYSRAIAPSKGSLLSYCATPGARPTAPGQMSAVEALDLYRLPRIGRATAVYGIAGYPVTHSLSPLVHNTLFARHGIDAVYLPLPSESFEELFTFASRAGLTGMSVTMPHKEAAYHSSDSADDAARRIGATNTLKRKRDTWIAAMSDGIALAEEITARIGSIEGLDVLILGPGGAGRAAACALDGVGASVHLCGRSRQRTSLSARSCGVKAIDAVTARNRAWAVTINATPCATAEDDEDGFIENLLPRAGLAVDLHYRPAATSFLESAAARGCDTLNGLGMFARQAARQFHFWTEITVQPEEILYIIGDYA